MVAIVSLWIPIVLSAVAVFVASAILHTVLPFHKSDFRQLPGEDGIVGALRPLAIPPGDYMLPYCTSQKDMKSPEFLEKMNKGPVAVITVMPSGPPVMAKSLVQWFVYCLAVSVIAAYVTGRAVSAGTTYLEVFRFAGCVAFVGYSLALWQDSIWYRRAWLTTIKNNVDGLIYGLLTAGVFGWLWPR